jgi:hypothetical protein
MKGKSYVGFVNVHNLSLIHLISLELNKFTLCSLMMTRQTSHSKAETVDIRLDM